MGKATKNIKIIKSKEKHSSCQFCLSQNNLISVQAIKDTPTLKLDICPKCINEIYNEKNSILKVDTNITNAISSLKNLCTWSDRIGSDEIAEINNIIKILNT